MIGAGCGGAGCLGLVVVAIAAGFLYWSYRRVPPRDSDNYNSSRDSNNNSSTTSSSPSSSSSTSDDDRHKLFQAASSTNDRELIKKVNQKLGLLDADGTPNKKYPEFVRDHFVWIFGNTDWITQHNTPEKARAYVEEHIND